MLIRSRGFKKFNNLTALLHARLRPLLLRFLRIEIFNYTRLRDRPTREKWT